jgi:hypothetical protein
MAWIEMFSDEQLPEYKSPSDTCDQNAGERRVRAARCGCLLNVLDLKRNNAKT